MFCPKCGTKNDENANYCEVCGKSLQKNIHKQNIYAKNKAKIEGMSNTVKTLMVIFVVLIAGIGLAVILHQNPVNLLTIGNQSSNAQKSAAQPTWHQIKTYTGPGEVNTDFSIQGNQFKVIMSATPMMNWKTNDFNVNIENGNLGVASGTLQWNVTETEEKSTVIPVFKGPGAYTINIDPKHVQNYTVTVWDYY